MNAEPAETLTSALPDLEPKPDPLGVAECSATPAPLKAAKGSVTPEGSAKPAARYVSFCFFVLLLIVIPSSWSLNPNRSITDLRSIFFTGKKDSETPSQEEFLSGLEEACYGFADTMPSPYKMTDNELRAAIAGWHRLLSNTTAVLAYTKDLIMRRPGADTFERRLAKAPNAPPLIYFI
jgi:hypothetical protein